MFVSRVMGDDIAPAPSDARRSELIDHLPAFLAELIDALAGEPTLLLLTPGPATQQVEAILGPGLTRGPLRAQRLPWLPQDEFDLLLWACQLNFVRGEDSLVRALWAGSPFVWQLYPQDDGAHEAKLDAFLGAMFEAVPGAAAAPLPAALRSLFRRWNDLSAAPAMPLLDDTALNASWAARCTAWRGVLGAQRDLVTGLLEFVAAKQ